MAFRRTRRLIASSLVVAGSLSGLRIVAHAQDWTITPRLSDQEEFTDNVLFTPTDTHSDLISTLSPGINITGASNRLQGTLDYSPTAYLYALTPSQDLLGQNLYANGTATLVPDTFFVDARAGMSLLPSTPGLASGAIGPTAALPSIGFSTFAPQGIPTAQLTQSTSFSLSPYLAHRFDDFGSAELRYTLSDTSLSGGTNVLGAALPGTTETTNEATAAFLTGERLGPFIARLTLDDAQSTGTGIFNGANQQIAVVDSAYAVTGRFALLATLGHEDINFGGIPPTHIDDLIWAGGVQYTPSLNSSISLSYGHRDGITAPAVSIVYNATARTVLTANYTTGLSNTAQDLANNLAVSGINAEGQLVDTRTLLPTSLVNAALGVQTGLYRTKQFTGTAALNLDRDQLTASIMQSDNQVVAQNTLGSATSQNTIGGNFNWAHQISPLTATNLGVGYSQNSFPGLDGTGLQEGLLTISASISYMLTASLTAWAGYNRTDRTSPDPALRLTADIIFAGVSKTF